MPHRITQPTKEQVRAYMAGRESARRPPPPPEEIRRQLGWRIAPPDDAHFRIQFYPIPTVCSHLATQMLIDWWLAAAQRAARHAQRR